MEEGAADADGGVEGAVEEGHGAAPGGHGREAEDGQPVEEGGGCAPEGRGLAEVSALLGQGAAPKGRPPSPKKGDGAAPCGHGGEAECGEGMDPNSTYLMKIKLLGNPKKARKDIRCFCFDKVIDSDITNYKDLVESIVEQYPPRLNAKTRELELEVVESSEEVAEVTALGGSGFRFVVNLLDRTCSCRQWQVSGLPCKHGLAFITSLINAHIQNYVDLCYSVDKFRAAYNQLIPAMVDKNQWPKSDHGFFMFPPLLKSTAGRPKSERYKGCGEKKRKSGQHLCPICKDYGHHWHKCKKGNPDDIAAILALRGPPKKRTKTTKSAQASIVPCEDDAPAASMCFPPSQSLDTTTTKKTKHDNSITGASKSQILEKGTKEKGKGSKSGSGGAKRSRTQPICVANKKTSVAVKVHAKRKSKEQADKLPHLPMVPHDSPAMGTRSKKMNPASPALSTRSKRRLSL